MRRGTMLTALLLACCFPAGVQAQQKVLVYDTGAARALGMGNAFTAVADDLQAALWNPAGIATLRTREFIYGDSTKSTPKSVRFAGYAAPAEEGPSGAFSYLRVHNQVLQIKETTGCYSFAQDWTDRVVVGANAKYGRFERPGESKETFNLDAGALVAVNETTTLGVAVLNVAEPTILRGATLPAAVAARLVNVGLAVRMQPFGEVSEPGQGKQPRYRTLLAVEVFDTLDEVRRQLRFGVEHRLTRRIAARGGLLSSSPTLGLGIASGTLALNAGTIIGRRGERPTETMLSVTASY